MTFAFLFSDVGLGEWFVLLAVILVVVGPKRLPETARKFGNWYAKFRRAADSFKRQLMDMDTEFERAASEVQQTASDAFTVDPTPSPELPSPSDEPTDYTHDDPTDYTKAYEPQSPEEKKEG